MRTVRLYSVLGYIKMIVIKVELWSARTRQKVELARMHINNQETASLENPRFGDYVGKTFKGRSSEQLNKLTVMKATLINHWPREAYHVWNLICKMLIQMGYTQGHGT